MNKYNAKKVRIDGIEFDSRKEAQRYRELKTLEKEGLIKELRLQVPYEVVPKQGYKGKTVRSVKYVADFVYIRDGEIVAEDVKGLKEGAAYNLFVVKKKLMLLNYGIFVEEI